MRLTIETENLVLYRCDPGMLESALAGDEQLAAQLNIVVPEGWTEFGERALQYALAKLRAGKAEEGWWTYLPVHKADNTLIGSGGYKGQPDEQGMVEIGYEIKSDYRNRGYATEVAQALVDHAFSYKQVKVVQAHTLGEVNPSTSVLAKCGFQQIETLEDEEEGTIWKWQISQPAS